MDLSNYNCKIVIENFLFSCNLRFLSSPPERSAIFRRIIFLYSLPVFEKLKITRNESLILISKPLVISTTFYDLTFLLITSGQYNPYNRL